MKIGKQGRKPVELRRTITLGEKIGIILRVVILLAVIIGFIWAQNNFIFTKSYIYTSDSVPKTFVGYKIAHVSDIHNSNIGVVSAVNRADPDIIIVTGGYADSNGNIDNSIDILNKLSKITTTLYITGDDTVEGITNAVGEGPILLDEKAYSVESPDVDESAFIDKYIGDRIVKQAEDDNQDAIDYIAYTKEKLDKDSSRYIQISGFKDDKETVSILDDIYNVIGTDKSVFQIIATSQYSEFDEISKADVHVMFSGSTHGNKDNGTKYVKGTYTNNGTTMFLSGGIGNLDGENRILNFPEITVVTLSDGTIKEENPLEKLLSYFIGDVSTRFDNDGGFKEYTYTYNDVNTYDIE